MRIIKQIKVSLLAFGICMFLGACNNYHNTYEGSEESLYYAKFEAYSKSGSYIDHYAYSLGDIVVWDSGPTSSLSKTLGPGVKGDVASISADPASEVRIYISKNNGPYILVATGVTRARYLIDF